MLNIVVALRLFEIYRSLTISVPSLKISHKSTKCTHRLRSFAGQAKDLVFCGRKDSLHSGSSVAWRTVKNQPRGHHQAFNFLLPREEEKFGEHRWQKWCSEGPKKSSPSLQKVNTTERLKDLRALMQKEGISAYIIPSVDQHMSEYVAPPFQRREYISGFTGSRGKWVIWPSFPSFREGSMIRTANRTN